MAAPEMIDPAQLHILRHSLGIDDAGHGTQYRNYYCAAVENDPCAALVVLGLMSAGHFINEGASRCRYYHVTDEGKAVVAAHKPPEPVLTRSQKRYRDWLKADLDITFGEYLRSAQAGRGAGR
jgi:hypothetical protein